MMKSVLTALNNPHPIRSLAIRSIQSLSIGTYEQRLKLGAVPRPYYGYCVSNAARLAWKLGYRKISVLEFGVAGGNGLVNLEYHAEQVTKLVPIEIEIYGFDTGEGLPKPTDYRDLPYHWQQGFFRMDVPKLKSRLTKTQLVIGDVQDTVKRFCAEYRPSPVAAVMFDLDFYSSTTAALGIFDAEAKYRVPRIFCYFDDVIGKEVELYSDYTGVRLAINEFNHNHPEKKIGVAYHLLASRMVEPWYHQIMVLHDFSHAEYNTFVSDEDQQIRLLG